MHYYKLYAVFRDCIAFECPVWPNMVILLSCPDIDDNLPSICLWMDIYLYILMLFFSALCQLKSSNDIHVHTQNCEINVKKHRRKY